MEYIKHDTHKIYFHTTSVAEARQIGGEWNKTHRAWTVPLNVVTLRFFPNPELDEVRQLLNQRQQQTRYFKNLADCPGDSRLRPYQRVDVALLKTKKHKLIFNQQRTGKSATTLVTMFEEGLKRVVLVCPSGLKNNWKDEVERWAPAFTPIIAHGTKQKREKAYQLFFQTEKAMLIIGYETLRNDVDWFINRNESFDGMVCDEAHRLRNWNTKQSKACFLMGKLAQTRYALTGTPSVNHPSDVFGVLRYTYPDHYTSYWKFAERYFTIHQSHFGKEVGAFAREDEFVEMLDYLSIQRRRDDIMSWIPPVTRQTFKFDLEGKQKKHYNDMALTFNVQEGDVEVDASTTLAQLTRLRQIACDPSLIGLEGDSPKRDFLIEYILDHPKEGIVIFSTYSSFLRSLATTLRLKHKLKVGLITGNESSATKQRLVKELQDGNLNIICANIIAGGTGFTMDRADTVIFVDRDYVPANNEQAQDRITPTQEHRARPKTVIDLVMKDTVEERILHLLDEKINIIQYVNNYGLHPLLKGA